MVKVHKSNGPLSRVLRVHRRYLGDGRGSFQAEKIAETSMKDTAQRHCGTGY